MNTHPPHGPLAIERERDRDRDREIEELQIRERHIRQREMEQEREREREHHERERQTREHYQPVPQHQNNTGAIPIHQPVASRDRLPGAIHSPGGLLANMGGPVQAGPLGAPSGPGTAFGGPLHNEGNRSIQQHNPPNVVAQQQQHQIFGPNLVNHQAGSSVPLGAPNGPSTVFGGPLQGETTARTVQQQVPFGGPTGGNHQIPGAPALGQGQQPILNALEMGNNLGAETSEKDLPKNGIEMEDLQQEHGSRAISQEEDRMLMRKRNQDALSYLDQVKVQFVDQPDVYNRFLDIMKDFKSQAIDTPGVINRVSELFAGHPNLIQGFNTFLPPGYRIECGTGNDPNTIRVTTPMGTTVQSITGGGRALPDATQVTANSAYYSGQRGGGWQTQPQHSVESPEAVFSPQSRSGAPVYGQGQTPNPGYDAQAAVTHQTEQRNMSHLQNAATRETGVPVPRNALTPTPTAQANNMNGATGQQQGGEKRGPVEFNHAISYVNKIKNRFQDRPEIYKQFLEILQTYQRESKPIQDVYAQVTTLFNTAPDLLEDFKQFLPESAAQAKAAAKAAEDAAALANVSQTPQASHKDQRMPPVGTFAPPSTSKENKKRNRPAQGTVAIGSMVDNSVRSALGQTNVNKRTKLSHNARPAAEDLPATSPTLTPLVAVPLPMPPTRNSTSEQAEVAFFDKVKKYLSNKQTFAEFLKLCNLFTQDLIDRNVLVHKVSNFIGTNAELMDFFKKFVGYTGIEEIIENKPRAPTGRVSLSNCRGLGPSYRLLPKRERLKPCSGRDEMCYSVLNDDWASHPTWASEDSGFVAHRKNMFEESLHRIEEERHDYDFNIEANAKVIQLLEPIGQQILEMSPATLANFHMPAGLGGTSQAIYKRILKKVYGPEKGPDVARDLFEHPIAVLPIVLARLKQKDEEWKFTQREWDKIWHAQTNSMYLKSLDHMGIHAKTADKKIFSTKYIVDQIKAKQEEQRLQRSLKAQRFRYQYSYKFEDQNIVIDAIRLLLLHVNNYGQHNSQERERMAQFFERVLPLFFDIPSEEIQHRIRDISRGSDEDDLEDVPQPELTNGRGRRGNGKKSDLLRSVLNRKGQNGRQKEGSMAGSKESTPDNVSTNDEDTETPDLPDDQPVTEITNEQWVTKMPQAMSVTGADLKAVDEELKADQLFKRDWYSLYANQTILIFFSLFEVLYRRLKDVKDSEDDAADEYRRSRAKKPAKDIGLIDERGDFFQNGHSGPFYPMALVVIENYITGNMDESRYQDFFRRYYLMKGWQLYTVQDLLKSICRPAAVCVAQDNKEKTPDIIALFEENREKEETSYNNEINYRKQVEKFIKEGDMFLIKYYTKTRQASIQIVSKDQTTFELSDMEREDRWKYYISSFVRVEPTEGVPRDRMQKTVLTRNQRQTTGDGDSESDGSAILIKKPWSFDEGLVLQVCVNSYHITYKNGTTDFHIFNNAKETDHNVIVSSTQRRNLRFSKKFGHYAPWMKNLSHSQVEKVKGDYEKWINEGVLPGTTTAAPAPVDAEEAAA